MLLLSILQQNAGLLVIAACLVLLVGVVAGALAARRVIRYLAVALLLLGAAGMVGGSLGAALNNDFSLLPLVFAFGVGLLVIGAIQLLLEIRRKAAVKPGGLVLAVALLVLTSGLLLPVLPGQFAATPPPSATPTLATLTRTLAPTRTLAQTYTPTLAPSETPTFTPLPTLTLTFTRLPYAPPTLPSFVPPTAATADQTLSPAITDLAKGSRTAPASNAGCIVSPFRNVNLRAQPDSASALLTTIPAGTTLDGTAQVTGWYRVRYADLVGWVTKEFSTGSSACAALKPP